MHFDTLVMISNRMQHKISCSHIIDKASQSISREIVLGMGLANETWRYIVMLSLIGWAHA